MTTPFSPQRGLIVVKVRLWGPAGSRVLRLALDTGATATMINAPALVAVGYDPAASPDRVLMTTASGVEYAARVAVDRMEALRQSRSGFPVVAHVLPPSATIDGVLGLDFMRGQTLTVDFRKGEITLA